MSSTYSQIPSTKNDGQGRNSFPGFFSRALFTWLSGIFAFGNVRPLYERDLFTAVNQCKSQDVCEQIQELWTEEAKERNPRIWKSLLGLLTAREYTSHACSLVLLSLLRVSQPVLLNMLLRELSNDVVDFRQICLYIAGLTLTGVVAAFLKSSFYYAAGVTGAHFSTALTGLVYRKVFTTLRPGRLGQLTSAHVINLVSKDLEPVFCGCHYIPQAVTGSLELLLIALVLWRLVAAEAVAGMTFVLLVWIFQGLMKPLLQYLRQKITLLTDTRLRIVSDVISGIRTLKMNAWEWVFKEIVDESRRNEICVIRKKSAMEAAFIALQSSFAAIATLVSITAMVVRGHALRVQDIFTIYTLMCAARKPALEDFARAVRYLAESAVTLKRVEKLLLDFSERTWGEIEAISTTIPQKNPLQPDPPSLVLKHVTCEGNEHTRLLDDVTFSFHGNQLIVITGAVGSGKSSLLSAILGELRVSKGDLYHNGNISYVPQKPWLFTGTVSQNILFGKTMDQANYRQTVEECGLKLDFDLLPDGDNTFIGERGVSLSGGQQSRINLARAVYSDADIYLLDDPLSAVDAKVGQHIFERCILERLGHTLRILVTHRVEYFKQADCIVVMQNGRVRCQGKYDELLTSDEYFAELVQKCEEKQTSSGEEGLGEKQPSGQRDAASREPCDGEGFQTVEEDREVGSVSGHTYWTYVKTAMPVPCLVAVAVLLFLPDGTSISANLFLAKWTQFSPADQKKTINFVIYAALVLGTSVLSFIREFVLLFCALKAAEKLHSKMLVGLLMAPVRFFDTNPSGRIMNRFSRSVGNMDEFLPIEGILFLRYLAMVISSVTLVSAVNPWVLFASVPFMATLTWLALYFLQTGRELKRLEAISCSPLYVQIAETIDGVAVIRACSMEESLFGDLCRYRDKVNSATMIFVGAKQWMSLRAEVLSVLYITVVTCAVVLASMDKAMVGLSISYSLDIAGSVYLMLMEFAHTENFMTSVERVITYANLEPEAGYEYDTKAPDDWPREGSVSFENVSFCYFSRGLQILKDIKFRVRDGERIGIVGRTGAGKSSLVSAIFRMPEPKGHILIDDVAISTLNLQDSRSAVAAISQNPLLFTGTLRFNLDPANKYADKALWDVLDDVSLKQLVQNLPDKLESHVTQGGGNFSVGERQLLCVARALLQDKKIVVLDEATANVDMKTDRLLQEVIRCKLKGRTILTIAHRLETILDYDKVLVMDAGKVVEFDDPRILLERKDSEFAHLYRCSVKKD